MPSAFSTISEAQTRGVSRWEFAAHTQTYGGIDTARYVW
jgi:hypothetical protein